MVGFDQLWSTTTCQRKVIGSWLSLIGFGQLQPAKESDWVWLGMISFGWLKPTKKSDQVWLGLIGFGQLQPERKVTSFDNYTC